MSVARAIAVPPSDVSHVFARRFGWQAELAAVLLLVALIAVEGANVILQQATTPTGVAARYWQAMASGDSAAAWQLMAVQPPAAGASLLSKQALDAMLAQPENRSSATIESTTSDVRSDVSATVEVVFRRGAATERTRLELVRDARSKAFVLYPRWLVKITPATLQLSPPAGAGSLTIDGLAVTSSGALAVFPGVHRIAITASDYFQPSAQTVTAVAGSSQPASLKLTPTTAAADQVTAAIAAAITDCAKQTTFATRNCPQAINTDALGGPSWQLVGDPIGSLVFSVAADGSLIAAGHFQMIASYTSGSPPSAHRRPVGGGYQARLSVSGGKVALQGFVVPAVGVAAATRPAAADDVAVLGGLKGQFDQCLSSTSIHPDFCPQRANLAFGTVSNLVWKADRDQMAGASVAFDGNTGLFTVVGTYAMTATYDLADPYQATRHITDPDSGDYKADLFWDGQKAVFVTFE